MVHKGRLRFLSLGIVLVLTGIGCRLAWVQVVKAEEIAARSDEVRIHRRDTTSVRGAIKDRNLIPLAATNTFYLAVADQNQIEDKDEAEVAAKLHPVLGMEAGAILQKLRDNPDDGYIELKSGLTLEQKKQIEGLKLPGVALVEEYMRAYPNKSVASQLIGYMSDKEGVDGLEGRYEKELAGQAGYVVAEFTEDFIPIDSTIQEKQDPVPGQDVILSLDLPLQRLIEDKLDKVVKEQDARRAGVLVMDVYTGEILVMAMRPGADLTDRSGWGDMETLRPWLVHPMPLGSAFKTVTVSAALEEQAVDLQSTFIDPGELRLPGCRISNWDNVLPPNPVPMTVEQLMQRSSNVGLVQVGQRIGKDNFIKYLKGFGFLEPTGIDLVNEQGPVLGAPFEEKR
ncbi:MAG TPA: penicillin-binding transpeptidase domain-containing protein, partial [Symbiobacteriaceae bacterium]|nr:penicillin-binding transpeptidase domain-containing protein [Symbiobacteriaceae bacterium]